MRSSDWSSDVCSSDLARSFASPPVFVLRETGRMCRCRRERRHRISSEFLADRQGDGAGRRIKAQAQSLEADRVDRISGVQDIVAGERDLVPALAFPGEISAEKAIGPLKTKRKNRG